MGEAQVVSKGCWFGILLDLQRLRSSRTGRTASMKDLDGFLPSKIPALAPQEHQSISAGVLWTNEDTG